MATGSEKEPPPTPKSKLETLPKEDLIRFAKKQAISCKQLRDKNEELQLKLNELSSQLNRETNDAIIQTLPTSEDKEEAQWLRMALTTRLDTDQPRIDAQSAKSDIQCQTDDGDDESRPSEISSNVQLVDTKCQTEDHPKPTSDANPDALREAKTQLQLLANELDEARRQLSNQSMLKLEMEDTERSFAKLQAELRQSNSLLASAQNENVSVQSQLQTLQKRLANAESEREKAEKKAVDSESSVDALRKECNAGKLDLYQMETRLAATTEELEKMKCEVASDCSSTQRRLYDLQTALDETRKRLEKSEHDRSNAERQLDETNNEYRAYRTRVHSVLKQERKISHVSSPADATEDMESSEERQVHQQLINSLRDQLEKTKQLYESCRGDLERVREQHDQLYERHRMLRAHADQAEAQWKCELESTRSDAARISRLHAEQIRTLTSDKRDAQRDFERRLDELLADGRERVIVLEERVAELERDLAWSKQQLDNDRTPNRSEKDDEFVASRRKTNLEAIEFTLAARPSMERKPGENVDVVKKASTGGTSSHTDVIFDRQRSLEDLLGDQQSVHSFDTYVDRTPTDDSAASAAKLRHLTELLSESEANNSRLSEQIKLLKDEIRRLERNNERSEHVANAEYLKNIVMQFLNPDMQDRRQRLLPVLTTLLRLSPEEVATLTTTENQPQGTATASSGWSGYIQRWSGLN